MRPNNSLITNNISNSASFNSGVVWANDIVRSSFQIVCGSGSAAGLAQLQASNDIAVGLPPNQFIPTNWSNVGTASVLCSTTASNRAFLITETECSYEYLRVQWTDLSGGSANGLVSIRMKSIGL